MLVAPLYCRYSWCSASERFRDTRRAGKLERAMFGREHSLRPTTTLILGGTKGRSYQLWLLTTAATRIDFRWPNFELLKTWHPRSQVCVPWFGQKWRINWCLSNSSKLLQALIAMWSFSSSFRGCQNGQWKKQGWSLKLHQVDSLWVFCLMRGQYSVIMCYLVYVLFNELILW